MQDLKILLTGTTGQVGTELLAVLQSIGRVIPTIAPGESFLLGKALVMDLADADSIRQVVRDIKPDLIVNPAAYTAVDRAESEIELVTKINSRAPAILAELAKELRAGLIHYSTDYVYSGQGTTPFHEEEPTRPLNQYGKSKLAGDQAVTAIDGAHLIFRTSWVYGIVGNNFVKTMLRLGGDRSQLQVIDDQIGTPTFARTIADITAMIIAQNLADLPARLRENRGIYHLTCRGETSWYGFACRIFEEARKQGYAGALSEVIPIPTTQYPTPAPRPMNSRLSLQKLEETFNITPCHWEEALAWAMPHILKASSPGTK